MDAVWLCLDKLCTRLPGPRASYNSEYNILSGLPLESRSYAPNLVTCNIINYLLPNTSNINTISKTAASSRKDDHSSRKPRDKDNRGHFAFKILKKPHVNLVLKVFG